MNLKLSTLAILVLFACKSNSNMENNSDPNLPDPVVQGPCDPGEITLNPEDGCSEEAYPDLETSLYVLPYPPGVSYETGLTNCSSSFHAEGQGDEYAFDFNMPNNSDFHAIRAGKVITVVESHPNYGDGTAGNFMTIDHGDETFALYYHSPPNGIEVEVDDMVQQGEKLGVTGTSGYAGYPHLHLIVTKDHTDFPFNGIPISFLNVNPRHTVLKSYYSSYKACEY